MHWSLVFFFNDFIFTMEILKLFHICNGTLLRRKDASTATRPRWRETGTWRSCTQPRSRRPSPLSRQPLWFYSIGLKIITAPRILAAAFQLWFHPVSVHLFLYICPMIAVYLRLSISPRISPSISVQTLCSTHKLCICPMNCKLFLNAVICASNSATVSSDFCICPIQWSSG